MSAALVAGGDTAPPVAAPEKRRRCNHLGRWVAVTALVLGGVGVLLALSATPDATLQWQRESPALRTGLHVWWAVSDAFQFPALHDDMGWIPSALHRAGAATVDALEAAVRRATPANSVAMALTFGYLNTAAVHAATRMGIFDALYAAPQTLVTLTRVVTQCDQNEQNGAAADSLQACAATEKRMERLLRYLLSVGVLNERDAVTGSTAATMWSLTRVGACFAAAHPHSLRGVALNFGGDQFAPFQNVAHAVTTGEAAYVQHYGVGQFEHHRRMPTAGAEFDAAMQGLGGQWCDNSAVARELDWSAAKHVMEVGASSGALLRRVLLTNPHLRGTLFDQPNVITANRLKWQSACSADASCPPAIRSAGFVSGDFFDAESIASAMRSGQPEVDVLLLKQILHDWSDDQAVRILRAIRDAIERVGGSARRTRVVVVERAPKPRESLVAGSGARGADLVMLATFGDDARERTAEEFAALFKRSGLRLVQHYEHCAFHSFVAIFDPLLSL